VSRNYTRKKFATEIINNLLTAKQKQSPHIQDLLNRYIAGEIPVDFIYQQLKDCP
jgi:hypothetical protein